MIPHSHGLMRPVRSAFVVLFAAGWLALSGGCLVTSHSDERRSGNYVSDGTFSQIEVGRTTAGWVRASLGEPSERTPLGDGGEVWKYHYTETRDSSGSVFLPFSGSGTKQTDHTAFIEFRDGVVIKAWRG